MEIDNHQYDDEKSSSSDSDSESTEEFEDSIKLPSTSNSLSTEDLDLSSPLSSDQSKATTPQLLVIEDEEESSSSSEDSALQAEIEEIGNSESESISEKREEEFRRSPTPAASTLAAENLESIVLKYPSHPYAPFWDLPLYFFTFPYLHSSTRLNRPGEMEEQQETLIDQLRDGDQLTDRKGEPIVLEKIFKIQPKVDFIRFGKGSLQCKAPNFEPSFDLYVSPSCWFLYKHEKAMDCENIMNGNSISRTTIEYPADVYLLCTEKGDYVKCGRVEIATLPLEDFLAWLTKNPSARQFKLAHRPDNQEWQMFSH